MKSYFNETNIKIGLIAFMIVGVIFLGKYQKANSEFNISDMSIVNSIEEIKEKIIEIPKAEGNFSVSIFKFYLKKRIININYSQRILWTKFMNISNNPEL